MPKAIRLLLFFCTMLLGLQAPVQAVAAGHRGITLPPAKLTKAALNTAKQQLPTRLNTAPKPTEQIKSDALFNADEQDDEDDSRHTEPVAAFISTKIGPAEMLRPAFPVARQTVVLQENYLLSSPSGIYLRIRSIRI